jgi:hypothetical protein
MSPEAELSSRSQPSRHNKAQNRAALQQSVLALADSRVMTFPEWCAVNSISPRTGRRLIQAGQGPVITQLSPKRIGITVANNRRWQESRERA